MELRFGRDFNHVRVHAGGRPAEWARALSARAFTIGEHIVFAGSEPGQNSGAGRRLLAHELAHVMQQEGSPPVLQRQPQDIDALLQEAAETVESVEDIKKQLAEGKEYLEIVRWRLAMHGQKLPRAESPVAKSTTPFFVEALIETSAFLEPYVLGRLVRTSVADKFTYYDFRESFEIERNRLDRRVTPAGGATPQELAYGFYHRLTDSIHVPRDAKFGHALHEGIHKYSSVALQNAFGVVLNEGVTQIFTDRVLAEHPELGAVSHAYEEQLKCARVVLRWINNDEAMLARAYFGGDTNALAAAVRRRLGVNALQFTGLVGDRDGLGLCERILAAP